MIRECEQEAGNIWRVHGECGKPRGKVWESFFYDGVGEITCINCMSKNIKIVVKLPIQLRRRGCNYCGISSGDISTRLL